MNKKSLAVAVVLAGGLLLQSTNAFARESGGRQHHERAKREVVVVGKNKYNYHNGRFYKPGIFSINFAMGIPPFGAVVHFLPFGHRPVVVRGATYYYYNNTYYKPYSDGYLVVPDPVVSVPQNIHEEKVTINILNSNGSYTGVELTKYRGGYLGPQGEFYPQHPTVAQLRGLYGR